MPLTLRRTGLSSPAYRDWLDYVIVEDGRDVGRVYEDRHNRPELRWFWSITIYVNPKRGITTSGRVSNMRSFRVGVERQHLQVIVAAFVIKPNRALFFWNDDVPHQGAWVHARRHDTHSPPVLLANSIER